MMKKKVKIGDVICFISVAVAAIIFSYYFIMYRAADGQVVETLANEADYPVYSGKNVYEYWKTTLDEDNQILYDEIKESFLQFKSSFSTQVDEMTKDDFQDAYTAVLLDHPEIFWMKSYNVVPSFDEKSVNTNKNIELVYEYNEDEAKKIKEQIEPRYTEIIEGAKQQENDFKRIKYVHDKLIQMSTYTEYTEEEMSEYQSIISIFRDGKTVCAGYSYGFKYIMDELGIDSLVTRDVSNEDVSKNHIWNMVKLYDKWYNIDITYDGSLTKDNVIAYNYFLKINEDFYTNHKMQPNIPQNEE